MTDQPIFLRQAMGVLQMTRDEFAARFGITRRALDTWLLPPTSSEFRPISETARRYIVEVLWLYVAQRLTYTRSVHILEAPNLESTSMNYRIDPLLVTFNGVRTKEGTQVHIVVDGVARPLPFHLAVRAHSPDGFEWGYGGSGPSQLALAMCVELLGPQEALKVYELVKDRLIAPIQGHKWAIRAGEILDIVEEEAA
jgi:hypothetical protein